MHHVVATLTERDAGQVVSNTFLCSSGLLVSFSGIPLKQGVHEMIPMQYMEQAVAKLRDLAAITNAADDSISAAFRSELAALRSSY